MLGWYGHERRVVSRDCRTSVCGDKLVRCSSPKISDVYLLMDVGMRGTISGEDDGRDGSEEQTRAANQKQEAKCVSQAV